MKRLRRIVGLTLVLVLTLAMSVTMMVSSTSNTYTITITSEKSGHTYEAYQIFSGTLYEETNASTGEVTRILSDIEWGNGVNSDALISALKSASETTGNALYGKFPSTDNNGTITYTAERIAEIVAGFGDKSYAAEEFAQIVSQHLTSTVAGTSTGGTTAGTDGKYTYTINNLSAGYYLVKDKDSTVTSEGDAYTDIILEVVSNVSIKDKAVYPTVTKTVSSESASINDTVTFTLTGTVPDTSAYTSYTYIFNDTLSAGLTYSSGSLKVTVDGVELSESSDYTLSVGTYDATNGTFITITMSNAKSLSKKTIIVTYDATLNSNAVIGNDGNMNTVNVTYSNNPNNSGTGTTTTEKVVTFTFELDVTKEDGDTNVGLKDAQFVLYKVENGKTYYLIIDSSNKVASWTQTKTDASTLTSDASGNFSIIGLAEGTYYLEETEAPDGYNKLTSAVKIVIDATYVDTDNDGVDEVSSLTVSVDEGTATETSDTNKKSVSVTIENNSGSNLPSTGGIGTTIFYIVGTILVLGAAVLLITRSRMKKEEE